MPIILTRPDSPENHLRFQNWRSCESFSSKGASRFISVDGQPRQVTIYAKKARDYGFFERAARIALATFLTFVSLGALLSLKGVRNLWVKSHERALFGKLAEAFDFQKKLREMIETTPDGRIELYQALYTNAKTPTEQAQAQEYYQRALAHDAQSERQRVEYEQRMAALAAQEQTDREQHAIHIVNSMRQNLALADRLLVGAVETAQRFVANLELEIREREAARDKARDDSTRARYQARVEFYQQQLERAKTQLASAQANLERHRAEHPQRPSA